MSSIDMDELRDWARLGGDLARQHFNRVASRRKADSTLVTEADEAVERVLVERIQVRYPDHGIIGEEKTRYDLDHEFVWAIDPIDGTASFVHGLPTWGVSIGLLRHGEPYAGVIYMPLMEDCYWVGPDGPAYLNETELHVSEPEEWDSEDWLSIPSDAHRTFDIAFPGKTRSIGCTAASIAYVTRGSAIGTLITRSAIWDIAAGLAMLKAAGGVAVGLSGAPLDVPPLIDGRLLPAPCVVAAPKTATKLRALLTPRD